MSFTTRGDSLANRVLAYFRRHPDEQLSTRDIAIKFDAVRNSVPTLLKGAIDAGLLACRAGEYQAGPALGGPEDAGAAAPEPPAPLAPPPGAAPDRKTAAPAAAGLLPPWPAPTPGPGRNRAALPDGLILQGVSIRDMKPAPKPGLKAPPWDELLSRIQPGQGTDHGMPLEWANSLARHLRARRRAGPERWLLTRDKPAGKCYLRRLADDAARPVAAAQGTPGKPGGGGA